MKRFVLFVVICALLFSGCASLKKIFCALDFNEAETKLASEARYVDSLYGHYVDLLTEGTEVQQEEVRPIVVAMDLFLATAKPILQGLQQGICYPPEQIAQSYVFVEEVKARVETQMEVNPAL